MVNLKSSCWNENMLSCTLSTAATAGLVVIANIATKCRHGMCSMYSAAALHAVCISIGTEQDGSWQPISKKDFKKHFCKCPMYAQSYA
jgi:hypothetical protein